ncbi:hypothetical protein [Streptomyces sp. NPDC059874]|uniref:hypothetical protein n=1 Tax=Streptomyces sp. NPDC059874 TaxID=3346983 RepID=UPI00364F05F7
MRTAVRSAITAAVMAGALLAPAAGPYAAAPPKPASVPCVSEVEQVQVGAGAVAELTMSSKGPKAVVHGVAPIDTWSETLDRARPKGSDAFFLRIANPSGAKPVFEWRTQGGSDVPVGKASFPALPKGCTLDYEVVEERSRAPAPSG